MRLAIVGGALQGMEAAYLSKRAGYETVVIDRKIDCPNVMILCFKVVNFAFS